MDKKNTKNILDSQENFVTLQQSNKNDNAYGSNTYRGADKSAEEHYDEDGRERLGLHSRAVRGRPTLGNRWDTLPYEEGLWTVEIGDKLGSPKPSLFDESQRLIDVSKAVGDYIPSTVWETCGKKVDIPSLESVVFTDEENGRVVKFKDPFVLCFKDDSHLETLFTHHIHNRFFGNAPYRFLGVSKDPNNGRARFVFEQPFINTKSRPSKEMIHYWYTSRGFKQTDDKIWYTDGYVSFTDFINNDNCLIDSNGELCFIDPMIKFDRPIKDIITHYNEMDRELDAKLQRAGIGIGSYFRIEHMSSENDKELKRIDYGGQKLIFGPLSKNTHPDYHGNCEWSVDSILEEIHLNKSYRWIQVDENRKDIVVPAAKQAFLDRVKDPSPRAAFSEEQVKVLERLTTLFSSDTPKDKIFSAFIDNMKTDFRDAHVPEAWVKDMRDEAISLANGERREVSQGLRL